ncbi:MAG: alpha/beta hydrolase fold domain-containing protein [Burkholderiales bacterium]|nr:alpha/beta hydrolase fold domain-containing protein [Burkholderiales bacterium]
MNAAAIEIETGPNPRASVIWLHGLGADGNDFAPIARQLHLPLPTRFVFPHAPMQPVTINGGSVMRAWYDISDQNMARREDEAGIRKSQGMIDQLIEHEIERGISPGKIVLAGFSQGGAIALQAGLRSTQRLAGILALSTYLPLGQTLATERHRENHGLPIFMAHGTYDNVIPLSIATDSCGILQEHCYAVEWHEYPMPHSVNNEEIADIDAWLGRVLKGG